MTKKNLFITIRFVFVFVMFATLTFQQISSAQDCKIIRIEKVKGASDTSIRLDPAKLMVSRGTCVVWINCSGQPVKIVFKERAQQCAVATDGHTGFKFVDDCFVADFVLNAGTSSLQFTAQGNFKFEVVTSAEMSSESGKVAAKAEGEIIVQ